MTERAERLDDPVEPPVPLHGRGNGSGAARGRNGAGASPAGSRGLTGLALMMDVYAAETPYLASMLASLCPGVVEDVLQDVAELAIAAAPGFSDRGKAIGWLRKTARHHGLAAHRVARQHIPIPPERLAGIPAADGDPAVLVVSEEERSVLRAALAGLGPGRRVALVLNLAGLQQAEIARELGISRNTVRQRLVQGRKQVMTQALGITSGMACREFERSLVESAYGTLDERRRELLDTHLAACGHCRTHLARARRHEAKLHVVFPPALVAAIGAAGDDDATVNLGQQLGASLAEAVTSFIHGAWARAADGWYAMTQLGRLVTVGVASVLALVGIGTLAGPGLRQEHPRPIAAATNPGPPLVTRTEATQRISPPRRAPKAVARDASAKRSSRTPVRKEVAPRVVATSVTASTSTVTDRPSPPPAPPPHAAANSPRASAMATAEFRPGPGTRP